MADVPYGVLLSGGLDSSLVASVAAKMVKENQISGSTKKTSIRLQALHSFCIGLEGSPDLQAAKRVADFIGSVHHGTLSNIW